MAGVNVCQNNKFGYCKFDNTCRYHHINTVCDTIKCDTESCEKRHPKKCKYIDRYSRCKFGIFCKYSHVTLSKNSENEDTSKVELHMEIIELKNKNEEIRREIDLLKRDIYQIIRENSEMKKVIELLKEKKTEEIDIISNNDKNEGEKHFKCDECNFQGKQKNGLKIHKSLKHKKIIQVDGNDDVDYVKETGTDDIEENIDNNMELKAVFVAEDKYSAESDIRKYYIGEIVSDYSEEIKLIENESGEVYDGEDSFYTKRNFKKYTFTFKISRTYSWEDIKMKMFTDQVKDLFII